MLNPVIRGLASAKVYAPRVLQNGADCPIPVRPAGNVYVTT